MEPKVLADALVEAGIGSLLPTRNKYGVMIRSCSWYEIDDDEFMSETTKKSAEHFISDWRVAGKVLESWEPRSYSQWILSVATTRLAKILRDPRAIIEAWYAATEQGESDE